MTLLDAYALVAFLIGGPASSETRAILREGDAAVATANLVEALDVCARVYRLPIERALDAVEPLFEASLREIPLDSSRARRAAEIRVRHYHRKRCPISLGDAILLGSAAAGDRIATADPDVLRVTEAEGLNPFPLPGQG